MGEQKASMDTASSAPFRAAQSAETGVAEVGENKPAKAQYAGYTGVLQRMQLIMVLVAFLWGTLVLGAAIVLSSSGVPFWWLSLLFGALVLGLLLSSRKWFSVQNPLNAQSIRPETNRLEHETVVSTTAFTAPQATMYDDPPALREDLSERELEVLKLVASGRTNSEIASELYLAVGTVKAHISNIYCKLEARNRAEAIAKARRLKLLS